MTPSVSVILSCHNQADYLKVAIKSVLNQTYQSFEVVVINDASTDATAAILSRIKDTRVRVITASKRLGLAQALNQAARVAKGKYLARMDADDIAAKNRLKIQVAYLEKHPTAAMCGSAVTLIDKTGVTIGVKRYPQDYWRLKEVIMRYNPFIHPTVMLSKKIFDDVGGYNPDLNGAEDYDLWLRLLAKYEAVNLSKKLLFYRVNPEGISWRNLKQTEWQALRARFNAIKRGDYPVWQSIFLFKPALSFLVPARLKRSLFGVH